MNEGPGFFALSALTAIPDAEGFGGTLKLLGLGGQVFPGILHHEARSPAVTIANLRRTPIRAV